MALESVNGLDVSTMALTDADRVKRFLELTSDFSVRRAGAFIGVTGTAVHAWRSGAVPEKLRDDHRLALDTFLEMGGPDALLDPKAQERMIDLLVADRLEQMAAQLRSEAAETAPPTYERTTQAKRVAEAVREVRKGGGRKRVDRKAE